eukprot:5503283-Amphidinium_carterae.3
MLCLIIRAIQALPRAQRRSGQAEPEQPLPRCDRPQAIQVTICIHRGSAMPTIPPQVTPHKEDHPGTFADMDPRAGPSHGELPATPVGRGLDSSGFADTVRHHPASIGLVTPQGSMTCAAHSPWWHLRALYGHQPAAATTGCTGRAGATQPTLWSRTWAQVAHSTQSPSMRFSKR